MNVKRFLIRRGFKIYPTYFLMVCAGWFLLSSVPFKERLGHFLPLMLFTQNYCETYQLFGQTWSLAVEEHFYLLIAIGFVLISRGFLSTRSLIMLCFATVLVTPMLRSVLVMSSSTHVVSAASNLATHLRLDSLAIGVLLAFYYRVKNEVIKAFVKKYRSGIAILAIALISPAFLFDRSAGWAFIIGYQSIAFGAMLLLLCVLDIKAAIYIKPIAFVGVHSYSIYIWHSFVRMGMDMAIFIQPHFFTTFAEACLMIVGSIVFGVIASQLVDQPAMKIRDTVLKFS